MIRIRQENIHDYQTVRHIVQTAFRYAAQSDGNEQDLVKALRKGNTFIPALSLVAELSGRAAGYILFSKIRIGGHDELALAPLGVLPQYQKMGIGTALIREGHSIARRLGYHYSVVLGDAAYYSRLGYVSAVTYGIKPPVESWGAHFMAVQLNDTAVEISGVAVYPEAFGL